MVRLARWQMIAASSLCACPQLLSDDFETAPGAAGGAGGASSLSGTLDAGEPGGSGSGGGAGAQPAGGAGGDAGGSGGQPGSCSDLIRNQDERGVDCGGVCPDCPCAFGPFSTAELLGIDIAGPENGPALSPDGRSLYFSAEGASSEDIFVATRANSSSAFSTPVPLASVNSGALDGSPALGSDGSALYMFSDRVGGPGNRDLWVAPYDAASGTFDAPALVGNVNSPDLDLSPALSHDGMSLFFVSERPGGAGQSDIWEARRLTPGDDFNGPVARLDLSSSGRDEGVALSRDGLDVVFASNRDSASDMDLWLASRTSRGADFDTATQLAELNTGSDELDPELSADGRELIFISTRGSGNRRLWRATRGCQ